MKVLLISSANKYGAPLAMLELCECLKNKNIEMTVILSKKGKLKKKLENIGIKCYVIPFGHNSFNPENSKIKIALLKIVKNLLKYIADCRIDMILKNEKYDIVHLNSTVVNVGYNPAKKNCVKIVYHLREFVEEDFRRKLYDQKKSYNEIANADAVIAISKSVKKKFSNFIPEEKIQVIYDGVKLDKYLKIQRPILCKKQVEIVMIGQMVKGKGHIDLLNALGKHSDLRSKVHVCFIGDGPEYIRLKRKTIEYNIESIVEFRGFCQNVEEILKDADILVMASRMEAFGRVTIEAMAANVLVIGASSGCTTELLAGDKGLLYQVGNYDDLYNKILLAINEKDKMRLITNSARQYAANCYEEQINANNIYNLYFKLIEDE